jgi:hypothetical protein
MSESILTAPQRAELIAFTGDNAGSELDDADLIGAAAERIGLTGDMAIDEAGALELERDGILVVLDAIDDEDAEYVDHPDRLHVGVYLRAETPERRAELEDAGLVDPPEPDMETDGTPEADGWAFAWWGAHATTLERTAPLPRQMQVLNDVMNEAEAVLERGAVGPYFDRLKDVILEDEP